MSRQFNGTTDELTVDEGGLDSILNGAWMMLALFNPDTVGSFMAIMSVEIAGPSMRAGIWMTSGSEMMLVYGGFNYTFAGLGLSADTWHLGAVKKAAGNGQVPRANVYNYTTQTWDTWTDAGAGADNDANTITQVRFGDWPNGNPFAGLIAAAGIFPTALADATIETLTEDLDDWLSLAPTAAWAFNQASTSDPVLDLTDNGADQTAITGTAVSATEPDGWSYGGDPVTAPADSTTSVTSGRTSTGAATAGRTSISAANAQRTSVPSVI